MRQLRLALNMCQGRVSGDFHWFWLKRKRAAKAVDSENHPLAPARAIMQAVPIAMICWILVFEALR